MLALVPLGMCEILLFDARVININDICFKCMTTSDKWTQSQITPGWEMALHAQQTFNGVWHFLNFGQIRDSTHLSSGEVFP